VLREQLNLISEDLRGKRVLLAVTGSAAAFLAPMIARRLRRFAAEVVSVMTHTAAKLIGPELMKWATGHSVITELSGKAEHIHTAQEVDAALVAPCTANMLVKMALGVCDDPVSTTIAAVRGEGKRVVVAPAMHLALFRSPTTQKAINSLREQGVIVVEPVVEEGKAKLAPVEEIVDWVIRVLQPDDLRSRRVVVTGGPTLAHIDPIRVITNRSTGEMGVLIAREAWLRKADVVLVLGPTLLTPPRYLGVAHVQTTEDMIREAQFLTEKGCDVFIAAAAPVDYTPKAPREQKIRTCEEKTLMLELQALPKVLDQALGRARLVVAFKSEWGASAEELIQRGRELIERGVDVVVAHDASQPGAGFGEANLYAVLVTRDREEELGLISKRALAKRLVSEVVRLLT